MSGTSNVSPPSKGSTLSYDAPAFIPSFLRNSTIQIQRLSTVPSSTPPRVATPIGRKLSHLPLPIGQVLQGYISLQQPFDELSYNTLTSLDDPEGELKSESRYIRNSYFRHYTLTRPYKLRPVISAPVPSWAVDEARRLSYVFAMGTFEGHTDASLPLVLKRFAIPVVTMKSNAEIANSSNSIRITPTWNLKPDKECCWVVAIPVGMPLSQAPTKKWHGAVNGFSLEPGEMRKLVAFSDQRLMEFIGMAQNVRDFKEYATTLRTSRSDRREPAPSTPVTNVKVVFPIPSTSSSKPPTQSPPTPFIKNTTPPTPSHKEVEIVPDDAMCRVSKRGREEESSNMLDSHSTTYKAPRSSKRLCVLKDVTKKGKLVGSKK